MEYARVVHGRVQAKKVDVEEVEVRFKLGMDEVGVENDDDCRTSFTSMEALPEILKEAIVVEAEQVMDGINEANETQEN